MLCQKQTALKEYTYNSHFLLLYFKAPENIHVRFARKQILTTSVIVRDFLRDYSPYSGILTDCSTPTSKT